MPQKANKLPHIKSDTEPVLTKFQRRTEIHGRPCRPRVKYFDTSGTECILERLVRLKIIKDEDLNSFLESTDESMIKTRAAILERMKDQKINLRKFIL